VLASINIIVDIWILVMPISTLKNINRPRRDKIVLFIVFGVGGFSCISRLVNSLPFLPYSGETARFPNTQV